MTTIGISQDSLEETFHKIDIAQVSDQKKLEIADYVLKTPTLAIEISMTDDEMLPELFSNLVAPSSQARLGEISDVKVKSAISLIKTRVPPSEAKRLLSLIISNPVFALLIIHTSVNRLDAVIKLISGFLMEGSSSASSFSSSSSSSSSSASSSFVTAYSSSSSVTSPTYSESPLSLTHQLSFSQTSPATPISPMTPTSPLYSPYTTQQQSPFSANHIRTLPNSLTHSPPILTALLPPQTPTKPAQISPRYEPKSPGKTPKSNEIKGPPQKEDYVIKLLLLGDSSVGKSCLLLRYCENQFVSAFMGTIGIDFRVKNVDLDGKRAAIQIWDTAGQERFRTITRSYYRGAQGIVLVYDICDECTFMNLKMWIRTIEQNAIDGGEGIVKILVGNKSDLNGQRAISTKRGQDLAEEFGLAFFETSAKYGTNVTAAFEYVAREVKKRRDHLQQLQLEQEANEKRRASVVPDSALNLSSSSNQNNQNTDIFLPNSHSILLHEPVSGEEGNSNCCGGGGGGQPGTPRAPGEARSPHPPRSASSSAVNTLHPRSTPRASSSTSSPSRSPTSSRVGSPSPSIIGSPLSSRYNNTTSRSTPTTPEKKGFSSPTHKSQQLPNLSLGNSATQLLGNNNTTPTRPKSAFGGMISELNNHTVPLTNNHTSPQEKKEKQHRHNFSGSLQESQGNLHARYSQRSASQSRTSSSSTKNKHHKRRKSIDSDGSGGGGSGEYDSPKGLSASASASTRTTRGRSRDERLDFPPGR